MTCNDCVHGDVCHAVHIGGCIQEGAEACKNFKDKSLCIDLPCKVGDVVYRPIITDTRRKPAIHTIIITHIDVDLNKNGVSPHSYAVGTLKNTICGDSFDFGEIGKSVFLSREDAKKALENQ